MQVEIRKMTDLSREEIKTWEAILPQVPELQNPYFRPEFAAAVDRVREDVFLALLYDDESQLKGFFPFQKSPQGEGSPLAGRLSDYHGVIAPADFHWDWNQLISQCGLKFWKFDHLLAYQAPKTSATWKRAPSPYIDLSKGFADYERYQLAEHFSSYKRMRRKMRQTEREAGKIVVRLNQPDRELFNLMVSWKRAQYKTSGVSDVLSFPWTTQLLQEIMQQEGECFSSWLTVLEIGGKVASILYSLRSRSVLHAWFSAYSPEFAAYSPGMTLLFKLIEASGDASINRIDVGKGPEPYKKHLQSSETFVAEGVIDTHPLRGLYKRKCFQWAEWLRESPLRKPLLTPARIYRRWREKKVFK